MGAQIAQHPFANAWRCDLADVEEVPISDEYPVGIKWNTPCLCPCFMYVRQTQDVGLQGGRMIVREITVQGCKEKLYPWVEGSRIQAANKASADAEKNSAEITRAADAVLSGLAQVGQALDLVRLIQAQNPMALLVAGMTAPPQTLTPFRAAQLPAGEDHS